MTCYIPVDLRDGGKQPGQRKAMRGVMIGYEDGTDAYRVWDLQDKIVRRVSFAFTIAHEGYYPFRDKVNWTVEMKADPKNFWPDGMLNAEAALPGEAKDAIPEVISESPHDEALDEKHVDEPEPELRRSTREHRLPAKYRETVLVSTSVGEEATYDSSGTNDSDSETEENMQAMRATLLQPVDTASPSRNKDKPSTVPPPSSYKEAMRSPWAAEYKQALQVELEGHTQNGTWEVVKRSEVPKGRNILKGKWVFDDKRDGQGKILKYKARYVAKGFTQKYGEDYTETFAGVVIGKSFRVMLAILNSDPDIVMEHWDVKMAFTQAHLEEELYMELPEGIAHDRKQNVAKLKKSLYGLKQSAHNWQKLMCEVLTAENFNALKADPCVFIKRVGTSWVIVSTHVDDMFVMHNKTGGTCSAQLLRAFQKRVQIENLGPVSWALKTQILRDKANGILKISQARFTADTLDKFYPQFSEKDGKAAPYYDKQANLGEEEINESLKPVMQSQLGALWWLAQISRPDIFLQVHQISKEINRPSVILQKRLKRIFEYLHATRDLGIVYQRSACGSDV